MRQIKFRSISGSGFKAYRQKVIFDLAPSYGLHFVTGENLAEPDLQTNAIGKSSIWDLFCWILKGRTLEGLRSPDLQSWNTDEAIYGQLVFDCDDERREIVRRTQPNSLALDGDPVGQDAIDGLFGNLSLEAIGHTIIHGQGREFFFDLVPAKKMELLSETLNLERWETRSAFASQRAKRIEEKIIGLRAEREGIDGRKQEIEHLLEEAKQSQARWSDELKAILKQVDAEIAQEEISLERIEKKRNEAKLANDGAGTERVALEREITQLETYWSEAHRQVTEKATALAVVEERLAAALERRRLIKDQKECPTCGQPLRNHVKIDVTELREKVEALRGEVALLNQSQSELNQQLTEARSNLRRFRQRETETQDTLNTIEPEMVRRQAQLRHLRTQKQNQINEPNPYIDEVRQHRLRLGELQNKLKTTESEIDRFTTIGERTRWWIKGFREIRLYVIKEALAQMQLLATAMLEESGLVGWSLEYVSEQTTKSETLKTGIAILVKPAAAQKPIRWENFSGGERQRLRLIGSRALAEVLLNNAGLRVNLEVFDEPTSALSARGIEDLIEMLAEQARWSHKAIFFVDHHSIPSDHFASVIKIVRDRSGSYVE